MWFEWNVPNADTERAVLSHAQPPLQHVQRHTAIGVVAAAVVVACVCHNRVTTSTGGYDHTVKLWDVRSGPQAQLSCDHGAPVEDVAFFPSGGLMVSAGGNCLCVWDLLRCVGGVGVWAALLNMLACWSNFN